MSFTARDLPPHLVALQKASTLRALGLTPTPGKASPDPTLTASVRVLGWLVEVPIRLESVANTREHWAARSARNKAQRAELRAVLPMERPRLPVVVTLVRVGPKPLDGDNLQSAFKALRDELAAWLGCDDAPDAPVRWEYGQESGVWGVRVRVVCDDAGVVG